MQQLKEGSPVNYDLEKKYGFAIFPTVTAGRCVVVDFTENRVKILTKERKDGKKNEKVIRILYRDAFCQTMDRSDPTFKITRKEITGGVLKLLPEEQQELYIRALDDIAEIPLTRK